MARYNLPDSYSVIQKETPPLYLHVQSHGVFTSDGFEMDKSLSQNETKQFLNGEGNNLIV